LLRLARYQARLGFAVERDTARLAARALSDGALGTVSGARIGAEIRLALCEEDALGAFAAMQALGLFSALDPRLSFDAKLARKALDMLAVEREGERERDEHPSAEPARRDLLLLAALFQPMLFGLQDDAEDAAWALLNDFEFPTADRELVLQAAICADAVADDLEYAETPSEIYEGVWHLPTEAVALAGAWADLAWGPMCQAASVADDWLGTLRHIRPGISGNDLIAAGVPEGPEIGWRMREAHKMLLDGGIAAGRESELRAALDATD
jgi:tRNA nucleotidyltransferase (CCA-adding enzyme)